MASSLGTAFVDIRANTSQLGGDISRSLSGVGGAGGAAGKQIEQSLGQSLTRVGTSMGNLGRQVSLGLSLPLAAFGKAAVAAFTDFDVAMTQVLSLSGVAAQAAEGWREKVLTIGAAYGVSAADAAKALYYITSSGIQASDALGVLDISAKGAAIGLGSAKVVADVVTSAMNQYGKENISAAQAADILTVAVRTGKGDADELAGSLGKVIPLAGSMGVKFGEVAGVMSAMTISGTSAPEAATQINALLTSLQKMPPSGQRAMKALTGLDYATVQQDLSTKGLTLTLRDIYNAFGDNEEVIGKVFGNTRALRGITNLFGEKEAQTLDIVEQTTHALGAQDKAMAITAESASFKWKKAQTEVTNAMVAIGESVVPVLTVVSGGLAKVLSGFNFLPAPVKTFAVALGTIAVAAGPILYMSASVLRLSGNVMTLVSGTKVAAEGVEGVGAAAGRSGGLLAKLGLSSGSTAAAIAGPLVVGAVAAAVIFTTLQNVIHATDDAFKELGEQGKKKTLDVGAYADFQKRIDIANTGLKEQNDEIARLQFNVLSFDWYNLGKAQERQNAVNAADAFGAMGTEAKRLADITSDLATRFGISKDAAAVWLVGIIKGGTEVKDAAAAYDLYIKGLKSGDPAVTNAAATNEALKHSLSGVIAASKETSDAFFEVINAQKGYEASQKAIVDAKAKVGDAERAYAGAVTDAAAASRKVLDADRNVIKSGLKIAESREKATAAQKELSDALAGPSIDEKLDLRSAKLGVKEAQAALRGKPGEKVDPLDRERNKISLERAKETLKEAQGAHEERIAEATKDVASANEAVTDAVSSQDDAVAAAAAARVAQADAVAKVATAFAEIATARQVVADAEMAAVPAAMGLTAAQSALGDMFRTNTANATAFREYLIKIRDLYPELAGSLQIYLDKFGELEALSPPAGPPVAPGQVASDFRDAFRGDSAEQSASNARHTWGSGAPASSYYYEGKGRAHGGPLRSGELSKVNELGAPELWTAGGKQYLLPVDPGRVVPMTPADIPAAGRSFNVGDIYVQAAKTPVQTAYEIRRQLRQKKDVKDLVRI